MKQGKKCIWTSQLKSPLSKWERMDSARSRDRLCGGSASYQCQTPAGAYRVSYFNNCTNILVLTQTTIEHSRITIIFECYYKAKHALVHQCHYNYRPQSELSECMLGLCSTAILDLHVQYLPVATSVKNQQCSANIPAHNVALLISIPKENLGKSSVFLQRQMSPHQPR